MTFKEIKLNFFFLEIFLKRIFAVQLEIGLVKLLYSGMSATQRDQRVLRGWQTISSALL